MAIREPDGTRTVHRRCATRATRGTLQEECAARGWYRGPGEYAVDVETSDSMSGQTRTLSARFAVRRGDRAFVLSFGNGTVSVLPRRAAPSGVSLRWTRRSWPAPWEDRGESFGFELVNSTDQAYVVRLSNGSPEGVSLRGEHGWVVMERFGGGCGTATTELRIPPRSVVPLGPWQLHGRVPGDPAMRRAVFLRPDASERSVPLVVVSDPQRPNVRTTP